MLGQTSRQVSLFYAAFGAQASLIKDDLLEPIDVLLQDEELVATVRRCLATRHAKSRTTGRNGIAPDRLLRLVVIKHIKQWSFRELEREVRCSLVYRRFCRFDSDRVPHHANLSRIFTAIDGRAHKLIHARVVQIAQQCAVAKGQKLRTDTTVVETNIHYPADSTLLQDGVRVLTRLLKRVSSKCKGSAFAVRDRSRAVKHRVIEIHRGAKQLGEAGAQRRKIAYGKLLAITAKVQRQSLSTLSALRAGTLGVRRSTIEADIAQLQHFIALIERVAQQTKARVFGGDNYHAGKVLSLFEPHSHAIRKGKAHKPTEFGRLVRIDEVENGIISNVEVCVGNPSDLSQWLPALEQHISLFGRPPKMAVGDRGYFSAFNEQQAKALGVKQVALPARGKLCPKRRAIEKQRWFKNAHRFRAGVENRISTVKHRFGLQRAAYKGEHGFDRHVALGIIANNLVSIARAQRKKEQQAPSLKANLRAQKRSAPNKRQQR